MKFDLDKNEIYMYFEYTKEIEEWMQKNNTSDLPKIDSTSSEERRLAALVKKIKRNVINPYLRLDTQKERDEISSKNPEIHYMLRIVGRERIKIVNHNKEGNNKVQQLPIYLMKIREINDWLKLHDYNSFELTSYTTEGKNLKNAFYSIRNALVIPYLNLESLQEREEFRKIHPEIDEVIEICISMGILQDSTKADIIDILKEGKKWIENRENKKSPSIRAKDIEERKIASKIKTINTYIIMPYLVLNNEKDKEEYKKSHSELEKVMEMMNDLNETQSQEDDFCRLLQSIREVKQWIEENLKFPRYSKYDSSENNIAKKYKYIKNDFLKNLHSMSQDEQEFYMKRYPNINKILETLEWIEEAKIIITAHNNRQSRKTKKESIRLKNAKIIKQWIEENGGKRHPSQRSKDETEKKLGNKLNTLKSYVIKPYLLLTDEEKEMYLEKHKDFIEIMRIVCEIDKTGHTKKQKEMAEKLELELKRCVANHVDTNQEIRSELHFRIKQIKEANNRTK